MQQQKFLPPYLGIFLVSILIGILISYQYQSYQKVAALSSNRDNTTGFFQELDILLRTNQSLKEEIEALGETRQQYSDQAQAAKKLSEELERVEKLVGHSDITGPGVEITIDQAIEIVWYIDLVNELFSMGAEAVSMNGIRLVNSTIGFHAFPEDQVILNGTLLTAPYKIELIGDPQTIMNALNQPGGIIQRLRFAYPEYAIEAQRRDLVEIQKVI